MLNGKQEAANECRAVRAGRAWLLCTALNVFYGRAAAMGWSVLISIAVANSHRSSVPDRVTSQDLNTNAAAEAALSLTGGRVVPFF